MRLITLLTRPNRRAPEQSASKEAERLIKVWGETAYDIARNLSVKEAAGLLETASPGFWRRVSHEIAHQIGVPERPAPGSNLLLI